MPRWVDLSAHGLALKVRKQDDLRWLVLEAHPGAGAVPAEAALQLGFELREGAYQREGTKITLSEVQRVFPHAGVREYEVDELRASESPASYPAAAAAKSVPWWETSVAEAYAAVYLIGASRGKETLTLAPAGAGYRAAASYAGVRREHTGTPAEILHWLRTDVLVSMGDAFAGQALLPIEALQERLRLVKGEDLLNLRPAAAVAPPVSPIEVVTAPIFRVAPGSWRRTLDALSVRGSVPIDKMPWLKIDRDKWTDGKEIVDTATLAARAERRADVLEGEATRIGGTNPKVDLSYRRSADGLFVSFLPNTPAGETAWRVVNATPGAEGGKVLAAHAQSTIEQLRSAGFTVAEAGAAAVDDEDALLAELGIRGAPAAPSTAFEAMRESGHLVVAAVPTRDFAQVASETAIAAAAALSHSQFLQQARATHDGQRWHATLDGQALHMPPEVGAYSTRKRPEAVLSEVHEAQVRRLVERNAYACTSFASLVSYPALAFPGPAARGRMAEINIMRLLDRLGIADKLMEGDSGYCVLSNEPYMDLVVERHGFGAPTDTFYLTHYFDQNGDRVLDAEMVFAIERGRLRLKETATIAVRGGELRGLDRAFANVFSRNLLQQGFDTATVAWPNDENRRLAAREEEPNTTLTPH